MFYQSIKTQGVLSVARPDKTRTAGFLNSFKNSPQRACVLGVEQRLKLCGENIRIFKKTRYLMPYWYSLCKEYKHGVFYQFLEVLYVTLYRRCDRL